MPLYDYQCTTETCAHVFEKNLKIAEMHQPSTEPCPACGTVGTVQKFTGSAPLLGDWTRMFPQKSIGNFRVVLDKIGRTYKSNTKNMFG